MQNIIKRKPFSSRALLFSATLSTNVEGTGAEVSTAATAPDEGMMGNYDSMAKTQTTTRSTNVLQLPLNNSSNPDKRQSRTTSDREKNIFVTLSYIIFSYLACWVPFHFVFDISAINPDLVPEWLYTFTFWLTYLNSTLNPFLYAYSNKEFKVAFKEVLQCKWLKSN